MVGVHAVGAGSGVGDEMVGGSGDDVGPAVDGFTFDVSED